MAKLNRKVVVLFLVLVVSGVITGGLVLLLRGQRDPTVYIQRAQQYMQEGRYDEALMDLTVAQQAAGNQRADVFAMMAECEQKKRPEPDINKAIMYLKQAVKVAKGDEDRLGYQKRLVELLIGTKDRRGLDEALPEVTELVTAKPQNDEYLRMLAHIHLARASSTSGTADRRTALDLANEAIQRALAAGPGNLENYQYRVAAIEVAAKLEAAGGTDTTVKTEPVIREALAKVKDEQKAEAWTMLAAVQAQRAVRATSPQERTRLFGEAEKTCEEALKVKPGYLPALLTLSELARLQEDPKVQEDRLQEAVRSNPTLDEAYSELMELLRARGRPEEALKVGAEALEKCPPASELVGKPGILHRYRILMLMAETLVGQNKSDEAQKYLEQIRTLQPGDPSIANLDGQIAFLKGNLDAAYAKYTEAINLQEAQARRMIEVDRREIQRRAQSYFNRGLVLMARNLPGPARDDFRQAENLLRGIGMAGPEQVGMFGRRLAVAEFASGNYAQAANEARKVLAVPGQAGDYSMLSVLAKSLLNQNLSGEALVEALKCVKARPEVYEGYLLLAGAQGRLKQSAEQEQTLQQGLGKVKEGKINLYQGLLSLYRARKASDKEAALLAQAQADADLTAEDKQQLSMAKAGSPEERLKIALDQLNQDREDPARVTRVADVQVELNQIGEAVKLYKQAYDLALKKGNRDMAKTIWDRAWVLLLATDQAEEAKAWLQALPEDMSIERRINEGLVHLMNGVKPPASEVKGLPGYKIVGLQKQHFMEAIKVFEELYKESQRGVPDPRLAQALAQCYVRLALVDESQRVAALGKAETHLLNVIKLVPQDLQSRLDLAGVYLQQGNPDGALTQLNLVLDKVPDNVRTLLLKAEALAQKPDRAEAIKVRLRIHELASKNADNLLALGLLYESFNQSDEALVKFREASEAAADSPVAVKEYARRLFAKDARAADALVAALVDKRMRDIDANAVPAGTTAEELKAGVYLIEAEYYRDTQAGDAARATRTMESAKKAINLAGSNAAPVLFYSRLLLDNQDLKGAATACRDFLARQPGDLTIKMQLVDILSMSEETLDEAEQGIRELPPEILNSARAKTVQARTWGKMGQRAKKKGEADQAARLFRQAELKLGEVLKIVPDFGDAHVTLGQVYVAQGRKSEAGAQLGNVKPGDRWYVQANLMKAQIDDELRRGAEARQDYLNVLKVEPRHLPARLSLAGQYVRVRDYVSARSLLEEGLKYFPNRYELMRGMIDVLSREMVASPSPAGLAQLQKWADAFIKAYPDDPVAWERWAQVMVALGRTDEALKRIEEVRKARPNDTGLALISVELQNILGRFDDSRTLLKAMIGGLRRSSEGKFAEAEVARASQLYVTLVDTIVFSSQKKSADGRVSPEAIAEAKKFLEEAMSGAGRNDFLLLKLLKVHLEAGEPAEAVKVGQEIVKGRPDLVDGWIFLGQSYLYLEQPEEALKSFLKADELDPSRPMAANNIAWDLAERQKNLAKAWDYISRALNLEPDNADFLDTAGWIKYRQKDYTSAIEYLERSLRAYPAAYPAAGTQYHLAMAYALKASNITGADQAAAAKKAQDLLQDAQTKWPVSGYSSSTRKAFEEAKTVLKDLKTTP